MLPDNLRGPRPFYSLLFPFVMLGILFVGCRSETSLPVQTTPGIGLWITASNCPAVVVQAGNQVAWTNNGRNDLAVHAENGEGEILFDSGALQPGDSFTFFFSEKGSYRYRCTVDGPLSSTITVEP